MARGAQDPRPARRLMPASPLDSALYRDLFGDADLARLFTDSAEVRALLLVEGALAQVQGKLGLIPAESAAFLHRASLEVQIDPAGLAPETGSNAVPIPALIAAFRKALEAPQHAQYVHWGATSQDIMDTALALRLRQSIAILEPRLTALTTALGQLAQAHAALPMAARTYSGTSIIVERMSFSSGAVQAAPAAGSGRCSLASCSCSSIDITMSESYPPSPAHALAQPALPRRSLRCGRAPARACCAPSRRARSGARRKSRNAICASSRTQADRCPAPSAAAPCA